MVLYVTSISGIRQNLPHAGTICKIPRQLLLSSFCNLMSLLKWHQNNNQASTYHFQVFRHRGSGWDLFFPAGVLMFSSSWWWQEQNPLFTDVEHAGLVWASCVVFFLSCFPFVNILGMHLNHVPVLLSHYEPLWKSVLGVRNFGVMSLVLEYDTLYEV